MLASAGPRRISLIATYRATVSTPIAISDSGVRLILSVLMGSGAGVAVLQADKAKPKRRNLSNRHI